MSTILEKAKVLQSEPILFKNLKVKFYQEDFEKFFHLFLLQEDHKYIVYSPARYTSDDSFMTLDAFDKVALPISLDIFKAFDNIEDATEFYEKVLKICSPTIDYSFFFSDNDNSYGFDQNKSVHWNSGKKEQHDDFYQKEFLRHGYQRLLIRMFRFGNKIIINKAFGPEFESEEKCIEVFNQIKAHFDSFNLVELDYSGEETELDDCFERLILLSIKGDVFSSSFKRDELGRFTNISLNFNYKGSYVQFDFKLPTRNGAYHSAETDSTISFTKSQGGERFFDTYRRKDSFLKKLKEILSFLE